MEGLTLSYAYTRNDYADWLITVERVTLPEGVTDATLRLSRDGWTLSTPAWWLLEAAEDGSNTVWIAEPGRQRLWAAAPADARWTLEVIHADGTPVEGAEAVWSAAYLPDGYHTVLQ